MRYTEKEQTLILKLINYFTSKRDAGKTLLPLTAVHNAALREEFSKFGNVTKIFINESDDVYAKVYFDDIGNLKSACSALNGLNNWTVEERRDVFNKRPETSLNNTHASTNRNFFDNNLSVASSNGNLDEMEEDCIVAGDYVDIHGKSVEVLQGENGQLYVNLDDVRRAGFNIYKKESFENATISKQEEIRQMEYFLINQARKYILDRRQTFNENEMIEVMQRVEAKLQSRSSGEFGEGRVIHGAPKSKNFSITKTNVQPSPSGGGDTFSRNTNRPPKQLGENFKPTFSHTNSVSKREPHQGRQNEQHATNGPRRPQRNFNNRSDRNEDRRKPFENNLNASGSGTNQTGRPRYNEEVPKNIKSKAMANVNADEDPEESWEGEKTSVPQSKPHNDSSSVSNERTLDIKRIVLAPNATYRIKVSYIKPDKKSLFYSQWSENYNQVEEILLHVNTIDVQLPEIAEPVREMLCIAFFEDTWYRVVVLSAKPGEEAFVELIDYGNKEHIKTPLREMSDEMKKIPGLAIRTALHQTPESNNLALSTGQELEVFVRKHYDDQTHLVEIRKLLEGTDLDKEEPSSPPSDVGSEPESPKPTEQKAATVTKPAASKTEECFTQIPPSKAKLANGESVMIVGYTEDTIILRNRETANICKDVYSHLAEMDKKPISNPKVGQLVLCSRDDMEGLHRAVIKSINNQVADLEYLDYYGGETLSLKSLRNVDQVLATHPSAKIESPVFESLQKVTEHSLNLLNKLIVTKTKLKVVLDGSKFDLRLSEGDKTSLLSEKISQLEEPEKPAVPVEAPTAQPARIKEPAGQPKPTPAATAQPVTAKEPAAQPKPTPAEPVADPDVEQYVKITYDEMPFVTAEIGEDEYFLYGCHENSVTLMRYSDAEKYLQDLEVSEPNDTDALDPEQPFEMCLAKFQDVWYRATIYNIGEETCEVLFVDYGNSENIPKTDLRRFPKKFTEIPILGINAYFMGIEDTPKVQSRLKELIPDQTMLKVDVKTNQDDDLKQGIEVPSIYAVLREENLI